LLSFFIFFLECIFSFQRYTQSISPGVNLLHQQERTFLWNLFAVTKRTVNLNCKKYTDILIIVNKNFKISFGLDANGEKADSLPISSSDVLIVYEKLPPDICREQFFFSTAG